MYVVTIVTMKYKLHYNNNSLNSTVVYPMSMEMIVVSVLRDIITSQLKMDALIVNVVKKVVSH